MRHFGTAEDPLPEGTFGRATHAKPGETVAEYIQSYPKSALKQWALHQAEDVYARYTGDLCLTLCFTIAVSTRPDMLCAHSSKLEPLGKGYVRGHKIPEGLGTQLPFGTAVNAKVQLPITCHISDTHKTSSGSWVRPLMRVILVCAQDLRLCGI